MLRVRYEDLVRAPEATFETLRSFLKVAGSYRAPERLKDAVEEGNSFSDNAFKPITTHMLEKWRNQLSTRDADLSIIQRVCAAGMQELGYETADTSGDHDPKLNMMTQQLRFAVLKVFGSGAGT